MYYTVYNYFALCMWILPDLDPKKGIGSVSANS